MKTQLLAIFLALPLAACVPQVVDQSAIDDDGGAGGTEAGGGAGGAATNPTGGGSAVVAGDAVAMTRLQLDALWDAYWEEHDPNGSSGQGGGGSLDPNDLFIRISDLGASCSEPTTELGCGEHWQLSIAIPPSMQQVGVYDLEDPQILMYSTMTESGPQNSPDPEDCGWGGGSLGPGTLEILAITATEIHIRVDMSAGLWTNDPSGEYTALRCP